MFFRKLEPKDHHNTSHMICSSHLEQYQDNIYIIENKTGILGFAVLNENSIESMQTVSGLEYEFLMIIEEFLFMKYEYIILNNNFKNLEEYGWEKVHSNQYKKNKAPKDSRRYYMEVKIPE